MSISWAAEQLRATGEPQDEAYASILDSIVVARGADIDMPESFTALAAPGSQVAINENRIWDLEGFHAPAAIGYVLLRDGDYDNNLNGNESIEKVDASMAIINGAEQLIQPYSTAFTILLPETKTKASGLRGHGNDWNSHDHNTSVMLNHGGLQVEHAYRMQFMDYKGNVSLSMLTIKLGKPSSRYNNDVPFLHINYDKNERLKPTSLTMQWSKESLVLARFMTPELRAFILQAFGTGKEGSVYGSTQQPSFMQFNFGKSPILRLSSPKIEVAYSLNSEDTTTFVRQISSSDVGIIQGSEQLPRTITSDQYLGILHQTLLLIPTTTEADLLNA